MFYKRFKGKLLTISKLVRANEWLLITNHDCVCAGTEKFVQDYVPKVYQEVTDIDMKHRAKHSKAKIKVGKVVVDKGGQYE